MIPGGYAGRTWEKEYLGYKAVTHSPAMLLEALQTGVQVSHVVQIRGANPEQTGGGAGSGRDGDIQMTARSSPILSPPSRRAQEAVHPLPSAHTSRYC